MNKRFVVLVVAVSIGLGAVIHQNRQKIAELEKFSASLRTGADQLQTEREQAREEIRRLTADVETFKAESEQLRQQLASRAAAPGNPPPSSNTSADAVPPERSTANAGKEWMKGLSKMFTDPEMKKTMRVQQMVGIRMIYGDLAKELGLPPDDANQLMEMLVDRQMDLAAVAMANGGEGAAGSGAQDANKIAATQKRYTEQLTAVLGPDRYASLQRYEGSIGDRFMLQQFEGQFSAAGAALEPGQKAQLLTLMSEERAKTPNPFANGSNPKAQMDALKSDNAVAEFVASQEAFNRRILDRSRAILSADQIATLEKVQQQQLEMMQGQMKMSRELFGLGK